MCSFIGIAFRKITSGYCLDTHPYALDVPVAVCEVTGMDGQGLVPLPSREAHQSASTHVERRIPLYPNSDLATVSLKEMGKQVRI